MNTDGNRGLTPFYLLKNNPAMLLGRIPQEGWL